MHLTAKQIELLRVIGAGGPDGSCDLDEILANVRYQTTKASLQFSIRALVNHGLIEKLAVEKRRGRQRRPIGLTEMGRALAGTGKKSEAAVLVAPEDDFLDEIIELS
jgi:DNA-binding PadR family transcriptional regulator